MTPLSRGARLCEAIIRAARPRPGGVRRCGRSYLAHRLGCSNRTVSRYVRELREAGRLEVIAPRRVRTVKGWRTCGTNTYRTTQRHDLAPHRRRSRRGDTPVTPPPSGGRAAPSRPAEPDPQPGPAPDPVARAAHAAACRAALAAVRRRGSS